VDEHFEVLSKAPTMSDLVLLTIVVKAILFCSGMRGAVLDGSQTPDSGLILDGVEDFVDGEPERSELLYRLVGSERTWSEDREHLPLIGRLPSVPILGMGGSFVQRLCDADNRTKIWCIYHRWRKRANLTWIQ